MARPEMSEREARELTDDDAKLFIGNLSYHVRVKFLYHIVKCFLPNLQQCSIHYSLEKSYINSCSLMSQTREERLLETFGKYGSVKECRVARK